jgi:hypothetical protein
MSNPKFHVYPTVDGFIFQRPIQPDGYPFIELKFGIYYIKEGEEEYIVATRDNFPDAVIVFDSLA